MVCFRMDSRPLKALRKQTQQWQFGKQAIAFSTPTFIKQLEPTDRHEDPSVNVVKREFQNIKDYDLNYFRSEFIIRSHIICSIPYNSYHMVSYGSYHMIFTTTRYIFNSDKVGHLIARPLLMQSQRFIRFPMMTMIFG